MEDEATSRRATGLFGNVKELVMFEGLVQPMHLLLILGIALVVFGPQRLPELGRALGQSIRGFKEAISDETTSAEEGHQPK